MKKLTFFSLLMFCFLWAYSQEANYDESKIPDYTLPELLKLKNGRLVADSSQWMQLRRPEILGDFENEMYGRIPGKLAYSSFKILEEDKNAFGGKAIRRQVQLEFKKDEHELSVVLLLYIPHSSKPVPAFMGLNFSGNQTVCADPEILLTDSYVINYTDMGITDHKATEESRGGKAYRWQVEKLMDKGYALITACCGDIDPDRDDFSDGIHPFFYTEEQVKPKPDECGSIAAWAWGLSRMMDYVETENHIDNKKVVVLGHSRLGKVALWAGAEDERFAGVISNDSGCGGAALSRRVFGETVGSINRAFPHWFCRNFKKYGGNESNLPIDQHMLIALIAPRPVYIASALGDQWADPKGEYLSGYYASQVYKLFGYEGLNNPEQPEVNSPVLKRVSYHIREGEHDLKEYDMGQYIRFADIFVK